MKRTIYRLAAAGGRASLALRGLAAWALVLGGAQAALATPLNFTLFNVSTSNQSRLNMTAKASLAGGELTSEAQFPAGGGLFGSNGQGSMTTTYNGATSILKTNVTQQSLSFPGGSTAIANNTRGTLADFQLKPGIGGATGTAPGDYGVRFTAPQNYQLPSFTYQGVTVNLGTLTSIDLNVALRDVVIDVTGGSIPLSPAFTYPQTFDPSSLNIAMNGTADMSLAAALKAANFTDYLASGAFLLGLQQTLAPQGIALTFTSNPLTLTHSFGYGFTTPLPTVANLNEDATPGTLQHIGSNLRLTLPVKFTVNPNTGLGDLLPLEFGLSGQFIGQTPFTIVDVPEPSSIVLGIVGAVGLAAVAVRRRKKS